MIRLVRRQLTPVLLVLIVTGTATAGETRIPWRTLEEAASEARSNGGKILLFVEADWCHYCAQMHAETFADSLVAASIRRNFIPVRLNGESTQRLVLNEQATSPQAFARSLSVSAYPTTVFLTDSLQPIGGQPGFIPPDLFAILLDYIAEDQMGRQSFKEFSDHWKAR